MGKIALSTRTTVFHVSVVVVAAMEDKTQGTVCNVKEDIYFAIVISIFIDWLLYSFFFIYANGVVCLGWIV